MHFDAKSQSDTVFGYFYEEDGTVLMFHHKSVERIIISFSDYEPSTLAFSLNDMKPIDKDQKEFPSTITNNFTFGKCEFWTF